MGELSFMGELCVPHKIIQHGIWDRDGKKGRE